MFFVQYFIIYTIRTNGRGGGGRGSGDEIGRDMPNASSSKIWKTSCVIKKYILDLDVIQ